MFHRRFVAKGIIVIGLSFPAFAERGADAYRKGANAERQADLDAAYTYYRKASNLAPDNAKYRSAYIRMRFAAASQHVHAGQLLRNTGAITEALAEFQHALDIDSSNFIAQQELRLTADMIRKQEQRRSAPKAEAPAPKSERLELKPLSDAPISLHLTVNADQAYKTLAKLAGINVLIDPDYRPQKITLDLTDVTIRDALDMVRLQSKTFWRPVLANTIFVAADSGAKRKELEQNVMKTFYLQNVTTPNDLQEAGNLVKQMLDIARVQLLPAQDALIVRGTPDQLTLAEKMLADYDKPKPEVVVDVMVMQVSRNRIRNLGTTLPTSISAAVLQGGPVVTTSNGNSSSASTGNSFNLNTGGISGVGSFAVSLPASATFALLASDSNSKVLQNPQIRVLNNEKATLRIGDRVPIATGSFQPGIVGGAGVSPLVSTQFQYLDVGVNVDITPHIHADREVTLKMALEISSVTGTQSIGGITQPVIGQRRIEHETRLADGDVNLLAGILEDTETQSLSGYPWVTKVPILKYLFAQENKERQENEIVFAITPHIMSAQEITEENERTIEVGTGSLTELRHKSPSQTVSSAAPSGDAAKTQPAGQMPVSGPVEAGVARNGAPAQANSPSDNRAPK